MADIRKFTGFIALDGTTHDTMKKAKQYADDLKVKAALKANFSILLDGHPGVQNTDRGDNVIYEDGLPDYLFANRAAIQDAFAQQATTRAPRKLKVKAVAELEGQAV